MKHSILFCMILFFTAITGNAQKWEELSDEQKLMKLKTFAADNQKFMKDSLKLTKTQIDDVGNINLCYLATLDRIVRYGKDDERKEELAEAVSEARWAQLDAIMGKEKHEQYSAYLKRKIEKMQKSKK